MIIARNRLLKTLRAALERRPVVVVTGPRQCGKTTLARQILDPDEPGGRAGVRQPSPRTTSRKPSP